MHNELVECVLGVHSNPIAILYSKVTQEGCALSVSTRKLDASNSDKICASKRPVST